MKEPKLTINDIVTIKTEQEESISLVKHYAASYISQEHYKYLGPTTVMSATNTVNVIIGSAKYLEGKFIMPDEIHLERLVDWFIKNKEYSGDPLIITYYFAEYIKRKINSLYRSIQRGEFATTITILGDQVSRKELKVQINKRKKAGIKLIR